MGKTEPNRPFNSRQTHDLDFPCQDGYKVHIPNLLNIMFPLRKNLTKKERFLNIS